MNLVLHTPCALRLYSLGFTYSSTVLPLPCFCTLLVSRFQIRGRVSELRERSQDLERASKRNWIVKYAEEEYKLSKAWWNNIQNPVLPIFSCCIVWEELVVYRLDGRHISKLALTNLHFVFSMIAMEGRGTSDHVH